MNQIPIILIHGLAKSAHDMYQLKKLLERDLPDTPIYSLEIQLSTLSSVVSNYKYYIKNAADNIKRLVGQDQKYVKIISHSQGSAVTRCYIQLYSGLIDQNYPTVIEWYSLAGVCNGYYAPELQLIPEQLKLTNMVAQKLLTPKFMYNQQISKILTPIFQWRDLTTEESIKQYKNSNSPFVIMNGDNNENHIAYGKEQFLKLQRLVTFSSPEDEIISPWITSRFGFYKPLSTTELQEPECTEAYIYDSFGLRTLKESGRWIDIVLSNYKHRYYVDDKAEEFYEQYLKQFFVEQQIQTDPQYYLNCYSSY